MGGTNLFRFLFYHIAALWPILLFNLAVFVKIRRISIVDILSNDLTCSVFLPLVGYGVVAVSLALKYGFQLPSTASQPPSETPQTIDDFEFIKRYTFPKLTPLGTADGPEYVKFSFIRKWFIQSRILTLPHLGLEIYIRSLALGFGANWLDRFIIFSSMLATSVIIGAIAYLQLQSWELYYVRFASMRAFTRLTEQPEPSPLRLSEPEGVVRWRRLRTLLQTFNAQRVHALEAVAAFSMLVAAAMSCLLLLHRFLHRSASADSSGADSSDSSDDVLSMAGALPLPALPPLSLLTLRCSLDLALIALFLALIVHTGVRINREQEKHVALLVLKRYEITSLMSSAEEAESSFTRILLEDLIAALQEADSPHELLGVKLDASFLGRLSTFFTSTFLALFSGFDALVAGE